MDKNNLILKIIKGVISISGGIAAFLFGGFDTLFITLTALIILDFLSGILEAIISGKLSSSIGFLGIAKKVYIYVLIAVGFLVQNTTGNIIPLREILLTFFIANESLSILENATKLGVPFPEKIKDILLQLKDDKEIKKLFNTDDVNKDN